MTNVIELFNPDDKPFGRLSNNAYHPMTIDGKKYDTVTNYIYSNMLTTPMLRTIVQNTKIQGVRGINNDLMDAIDFLTEDQKPEKDLTQKTFNKKTRIANKIPTKLESINYITRVTNKPESKLEKMSSDKLEKMYKKYYKRYGLLEEDVQEAWVNYAKTGKLKESEDLENKKKKYELMISHQVRKPFESIDLKKLKNQILLESARNQMGIYQVYNKSKHEELFNTISDAVHKGYEARLKNQDIKNILIGTGNFPIKYNSPDPFLGIGEDGKGSNLVGKVLMQLRHNIRVRGDIEERSQTEHVKYKKIYNTYLAYMVLKTEMFDNKNQLLGYLGLGPEQIVSKYGIGNLVKGLPSQDTIIDMYKRDNLNHIVMKEIYQPGTMAINMRKTGLRQLRNQLNVDKKTFIFNSYLEYMIRKNFDQKIELEVDRRLESHTKNGISSINKNTIRDDIIEEIVVTQKSELSIDEQDKLQERIIDLFKLGMLSASLSDKIDANIILLNIPSEEDIEEAEIAILPPPIKEIVDTYNDSSSVESSGSSDGNPVTKKMKKMFKDDKTKREEIIDLIIEKKGGNRVDYKDWTKEQVKQRLESLEIEKLSSGETKDVIQLENENLFIPATGEPISIFKDEASNSPEINTFNPESFTGMLTIDNLYYPTIQHYIISRLISATGTRRKTDSFGVITFEKGMGIIEAHSTILVDPNDNSSNPGAYLTIKLAGESYDKIEQETNTILLKIHTVTSLNKKYQDMSLQDLLILTGNKEIQWNNTQNFLLGIGNDEYKGENYVGITMMDIRQKINESRIDMEEISIQLEDVTKFINKDAFIMSWVQMRLQDMCSVVYKLQQYLLTKDGININLNEEEFMLKLIRFTLDTVYQPCSSLVELSKKVNIDVPKFFIAMVSKCKGLASGVAPLTITDNKGNSKYNKEIEEKRYENDRQVSNLINEFYGENRIDHTKEESSEFALHQREDWSNLWKDINSSTDTQTEKNKVLEDFKEHQKQEYKDFWGVNIRKRTTDEISRHEHQVSELKKEFSTYLRKATSVDKHYFFVMKDIAKIYWNHIVVMLSTLIQNVMPPTASNIRDVLVKIETLNSEKGNCVRIISNEQDNCIVSGLLNLLVGIKKFKDVFSINTELDTDDVSLAGSIIMNNKFQAKHINQEDTDSDIDEGEPFVVDTSGYFPSDHNNDNDDNDDDNFDPYAENPYFGFKGNQKKKNKQIGSSGDLAKVEQQLLLMNVSDSRELAIYIMKTVQTVKNYKMSPTIKQNRINFFSSIR
jgi:predicted NAD-dependent protein-ADP-ribosyltransferase YbiA (DUF1768 family)